MEYRLTFADGSEAYLEHHGIKGMKWGVWNAETRARYAHTVKESGKAALKSAATAALLNFAITLNPASAGLSGALAGASSFSMNMVASSKHIDEGKKQMIEAGILTASAVGGSLLKNRIELATALQSASNSNFQGPSSESTAPLNLGSTHPELQSGILSGAVRPEVQPHPHTNSAPHTGESLVNQLLNADIPESLKRK